MSADSRGEPGLLFRVALGLLLATVAAGVGLALLTEPVAPGLAAIVQANLEYGGADNAVTAVLLNFRGYDTLLEIAVLTAALVGVWALGAAPRIREVKPSPVLLGMNALLMPLAAVICVYLLWVGSKAPGGAFQAGAVLAAAGVLYILSGRQPRPQLPDLPMRWGAFIGLAVFIGVGLGALAFGRRFLEYPVELILLIEAAATLSIAVILAGMFIGGRPEDEP
jgi:multisubunit Na+/H+ antiporter MnhB subunit